MGKCRWEKNVATTEEIEKKSGSKIYRTEMIDNAWKLEVRVQRLKQKLPKTLTVSEIIIFWGLTQNWSPFNNSVSSFSGPIATALFRLNSPGPQLGFIFLVYYYFNFFLYDFVLFFLVCLFVLACCGVFRLRFIFIQLLLQSPRATNENKRKIKMKTLWDVK